MRILLTLLLIAGCCTCVRAQVGTRVDAEYASWCMVDSVGVGNVNRFTRLVNIATREVIDIDPVAGTAYTVSGTLFTCEAYDLRETLRDPLEDLYDNCQCEYTITQENHRVTEIRGRATQNFDVEYQEVVRRKCAGQTTGVVVHRDTLLETTPIPAGIRLQTSWNFTAVGEYVDQFNLRLDVNAVAPVVISLDLNPATVQASYPSLTLNPADFEFDGSNEVAMAAAYKVVLDEALSAYAAPLNTYSVEAFESVNNVSFFTQVLHQPLLPYLTQYRPGDADYLTTNTLPNGLTGHGEPLVGATTSTAVYSQECEGINTTESGLYLEYNRLTPLDLQPRLNVATTIQTGVSNPTAFCDVSPTICAELVTDPVTVEGCIETCSDVLNIAGHLPVVGIDTTLVANEFNSISVYVTQGPVGITIDGQRINYPAGYSTLWSAAPGKLLTNSFLFSATGGEAIISFVR